MNRSAARLECSEKNGVANPTFEICKNQIHKPAKGKSAAPHSRLVFEHSAFGIWISSFGLSVYRSAIVLLQRFNVFTFKRLNPACLP